MRSQPRTLPLLFLALLMAGCHSYGPQFDPRHPELEAYGRELIAAHFPKFVKLEEAAAATAGATNRINPEWLKPPSDFFKLGPGDVLDLEILGETGSRSTSVVGPDGKVYYSLLPGVFVWGMTLSETREVLEKELAKYIRLKPEVSVTLKTVGSKRVWILGSVTDPGLYPLTAPITLLQAISAAGGTVTTPISAEETADLQNSFVMREGQLLKVDFYKLLRLGDLSQNLYLQPDDFVYVRSATAKNVYVLGAVAAPNVVRFFDQVSLVSAISGAGGTLPYAHLSQVAIVRGSLAEPAIAIVDYKAILKGQIEDVRLEPGDIVYVPFVPYRGLALFGEEILRQFASTIAINEGQRAVLKTSTPVGVSVPFIVLPK